ncbi:acyltransferase family protein [Marinibactrum halimedae]|nr:acyltransferase [Marinibactrum halimedae]MCD9460225.1 acyltransferase [Marinibactrum halimedae]
MHSFFVGAINWLVGSPGRISALDGLRAIAILFVLLRHGIRGMEECCFKIQDQYSTLYHFMQNGWVGVDLFFCLSGFFIGYHLLGVWPDRASIITFFGKYWIKRILRTFPLYYATIALIVLGVFPGVYYSGDDLFSEMQTHIIFMQDYNGTEFLAPLWSLAVEEKFYFVCPFLIWLLLKFDNNRVFVVIVLLSISTLPLLSRLFTIQSYSPGNYPEFFWSVRAPFHMAFDGLVLGLMWSWLYHWDVLSNFFKKYALIGFFLAFLMLVSVLCYKDWMAVGNWQNTAWVIYFISILCCMMVSCASFCSGYLNAFLSCRFMRLISRLSYSLYLSHMLVAPMVGSFFLGVLNKDFVQGLFGEIWYALYFLIFLFFSFLIALIMHIMVEKPFLKLKDAISMKQ